MGVPVRKTGSLKQAFNITAKVLRAPVAERMGAGVGVINTVNLDNSSY